MAGIVDQFGQPFRSSSSVGKPKVDFRSIGSTGLREWGGWIQDDFDPALRGLSGKQTIREMAENHPVITGILFAIEMLCRQVGYSIEPGSDDAEGEKAAEFIQGALDDMVDPFETKIGEIIQGMLPYGFHVTEDLWKRSDGLNSRFSDGMIRWNDWQVRGQETVRNWVFDPNNQNILGMLQQGAPDFEEHFIPLARGFHPDYGKVEAKGSLFRTTAAKGNPEGRSLIRGCYVSWKFQKQFQLLWAIGISRDLVGLPYAEIPAAVIDDPDPTIYNAWKQLVTNMARNEQEGLVYPSDHDDNGNSLYKVGLLTSGGARQFDIKGAMEYFDDRIAVSMLAGFILMGLNGVGSQALGASISDLFTTAVGAVLGAAMSTINDGPIVRLLTLNGMGAETPPKLVHGRLERANFLQVAQALSVLSSANARGAGFQLDTRMDSPSMKALMEMMGLPEPPDPTEIADQVSNPATGQDDESQIPDETPLPTDVNAIPKPASQATKAAAETNGHRKSTQGKVAVVAAAESEYARNLDSFFSDLRKGH